MTDAFIYDHVRTPRGKGKADGSLHEVTADRIGHAPRCAPSRSATISTPQAGRGRRVRLRRSGRRGRRRHRPHAALKAGYGKEVPGVQINRFCASGLDAVNLAAAQVMSGQNEMAIGGGVESMSRIGMGAAGGAWQVDPSVAIDDLFHAAGRLGRPDRDQIRLLARRRRRLCRALQKRAARPGRKAASGIRSSRSKTSTASPSSTATSTMRPATTCRRWPRSTRPSSRWARWAASMRSRLQAHPDVEFINHVHHAGNSSGIVDGAAAVLVGNRRPARPRASSPAPASAPSPPSAPTRADADRPGRRHEKRPEEGRHDADFRHRPVRAERGLRLGRAALSCRPSTSRMTPCSTSMAAPSPWATRSAPPAR
jgi:acetyl-CoA C-acetyltransferase